MPPKPIPPLSEEQFAVIQKEMKRTPSRKDLFRAKKARKIMKRYNV